MGAKEICHIYGLTETYGNCAVTDGRLDPPNKRFATVGRPLDRVDLRIVDPQSLKPVPNARRERCRSNAMSRSATTRIMTRTGTPSPLMVISAPAISVFDEDGYLHFRGRMKEMIKTGGLNVAPAEVEEDSSPRAARRKGGLRDWHPGAKRDEIVGAVIVPDGKPDENCANGWRGAENKYFCFFQDSEDLCFRR